MLYLVAVCLLPIAAYDGERTEQRWLYQRSDGELCSCAPLRRWCLKSRTITAACASQDAWQSRCRRACDAYPGDPSPASFSTSVSRCSCTIRSVISSTFIVLCFEPPEVWLAV